MLQPDSHTAVVAEFDRRLRALEATQRVGLNQVRSSRQTDIGFPTSTFAAWDFGSGSNTWEDDAGNTGTGYPKLSMYLPSRVLLIWRVQVASLATGGAFRSNRAAFTVGIDGISTVVQTYENLATTSQYMPFTFVHTFDVASTFGVGQHDLQVGMWWTDTAPAGTTKPWIDTSELIVIPLSAS